MRRPSLERECSKALRVAIAWAAIQRVAGVFTDHFITLVDDNTNQRLKPK